jgi:hypothetical protein
LAGSVAKTAVNYEHYCDYGSDTQGNFDYRRHYQPDIAQPLDLRLAIRMVQVLPPHRKQEEISVAGRGKYG